MWAKRKAAAKRQQTPRTTRNASLLPIPSTETRDTKEIQSLPVVPPETGVSAILPCSTVWIKRKKAAKRHRKSLEAPSLFSLPAEIRVQIYEYLLYNLGHLCPQREWYMRCCRVYPAILRTSKRIYQEASYVLYEKNRFYYNVRADKYGDLIPFDKVLTDENIRRIKRLVIYFDPYDYNTTARCTSSALRTLGTWIPSLITLRLEFNLEPAYHLWPLSFLQRMEEQEELNRRHEQSTDLLCMPWDKEKGRSVIMHDLAALKIQSSIDMYLRAWTIDECVAFGDFAIATASKLGWGSKLVESTAPNDTFWEHWADIKPASGKVPYNDWEYTWLWRLQSKS